ncbi:MAG: hypothetical protein ACFFEE_00680 [Candidatus Thorarchaeota archaeon]
MIEVFLYGAIKEAVRRRISGANSILLIDYIEGEHFRDLLNRLGLEINDVGNCYINNALVTPEYLIKDGDTIELNQR